MKYTCESQVSRLMSTVVDGGYCVGCGVCAVVGDSPVEIRMRASGQYAHATKADTNGGASDTEVLSVCPFSGEGPSEDAIGEELFGEHCEYYDGIGYYRGTYAGHVKAGTYRRDGSSGGMGTWILAELFRRGLIDGVVHVREATEPDEAGPLFRFTVSRSMQEIRRGAKSRYYPVEMSRVLEQVRELPGRYAVVGLPCFIKAVRLLAKQDPLIAQRVRYCVSLVCGHLKSAYYADMLGWQCGVCPGEILSIDFRHKLPRRRASAYGVAVRGRKRSETRPKVRPVADLYGSNWGYGFFKYTACDYCDDVFGETADVSIGDAWLPGYVNDSKGSNVVVTRCRELREIIESARSSGELQLDDLDAADVARSQDGGLRHRRGGLAYRLHLADERGAWRPAKRVEACSSHLELKQQKIQQMRMLLTEKSRDAFEKAVVKERFDVFREIMDPYIREYDAFYKRPLWLKIASKMRKCIRSFAN